MTKAEAFIYNSPKWRQEIQRVEDHKSVANTVSVIYYRYPIDSSATHYDVVGTWTFIELPQPTHRLVCYSSHGDSILWEWNPAANDWQLFNCRNLPFGANNEGNIEFAYDHVLPPLI